MTGMKTPRHPWRAGLAGLSTPSQKSLPVEGDITSIVQLKVRKSARVRGTIVALTYAPPRKRPCTIAEIADGTGLLQAVWLGRTGLPGLEAGRTITVSGVVGEEAGILRMVNPAYELAPLGTK